MDFKRFEGWVINRWPILIGLSILAIVAGASSLIFLEQASVDRISKLVDIALKAVALVVGGIWAFNRYLIQRTDEPQLKVECALQSALPQLSLSPKESGYYLVSFGIDILNTGKVLLTSRGARVIIDNVILNEDSVLYEEIYRWPSSDFHALPSIEPGSWAGISGAFACPIDVTAINLFLEVHLSTGARWTWHRIQNLQMKEVPQEQIAVVAKGQDT